VSDDTVRLVSVNVSLPQYLGDHRGHPVSSGIAKRPVAADSLWLDRLNLEGDAQADLRVHGGPDKAVYAYASEHLPVWSAELGDELGPAAFGENLTTAGWTEDDVCIGDRWTWGDAVLEVCQPRSPCYKLAMYRGHGDMTRRFQSSGRSGWYLRVLEPGRVPVAGPIAVERHPMGATVRLVHDAARPGEVPDEVVEALLEVEPLAMEWKRHLVARLPD
jgi:MOSC domain-containing protein YiiM